uniref:Uncharacterized protein n=1 Tax=Cacopsylla melanoneura TaxID=428564 RepID=A0A8D9BII3_9HEMI
MPNKSVTFGGVFHNKSATLPNPKTQKSTPDVLETKNNDKSILKKGFNCVGTLRNSFKMVSNNGSTLISIRLVRSKLRKREDSNLSPESGATNTNHNNNIIPPDVVVSASAAPVEPPPFLWLYSSKNNLVPPTSTTTSSQYTLYNNDQEVLVHSPSCEDTRKACNGSSGGGNTLKKNLGGKWKKLVKKKTPQEAYTIPAELKDQLKQIYVY